ncbi:hypothetical protein N7468_003603 [Penicillium chermesinum]|uniref:ATPase inhibitor, mitochondrial n=1 Tax=Penicillium chermesinum TaxID=63820 RepID=A0A9W9P6Q7_9EURO|nr:uncharacterized protein N7468_003603 [Penicillium chermesinum]KAJ5238984.1 hypothetical protein N7468_003603 [Penicillium chermesinum]KAJ6164627.1 hypothetical protein N7470_003299 [Penicillium chermesinum]
MGEGDAGAPKSRGHLDGKDAFAKREAASEGLWVKQHEQEKLEAARLRLKQQNKSTEEVDKKIENLKNGGEK